MPIYRLSPKNLEDHKWRISSVQEPVIVRAGSCDEAREFCAKKFVTPDFELDDGKMPMAPWSLLRLVECQEIEDPRWPVDGPNQILDPPGYED